MARAYSGFMLNLFNLIPLHPLDGGRTVSKIGIRIDLFFVDFVSWSWNNIYSCKYDYLSRL